MEGPSSQHLGDEGDLAQLQEQDGQISSRLQLLTDELNLIEGRLNNLRWKDSSGETESDVEPDLHQHESDTDSCPSETGTVIYMSRNNSRRFSKRRSLRRNPKRTASVPNLADFDEVLLEDAVKKFDLDMIGNPFSVLEDLQKSVEEKTLKFRMEQDDAPESNLLQSRDYFASTSSICSVRTEYSEGKQIITTEYDEDGFIVEDVEIIPVFLDRETPYHQVLDRFNRKTDEVVSYREPDDQEKADEEVARIFENDSEPRVSLRSPVVVEELEVEHTPLRPSRIIGGERMEILEKIPEVEENPEWREDQDSENIVKIPSPEFTTSVRFHDPIVGQVFEPHSDVAYINSTSEEQPVFIDDDQDSNHITKDPSPESTSAFRFQELIVDQVSEKHSETNSTIFEQSRNVDDEQDASHIVKAPSPETTPISRFYAPIIGQVFEKQSIASYIDSTSQEQPRIIDADQDSNHIVKAPSPESTTTSRFHDPIVGQVFEKHPEINSKIPEQPERAHTDQDSDNNVKAPSPESTTTSRFHDPIVGQVFVKKSPEEPRIFDVPITMTSTSTSSSGQNHHDSKIIDVPITMESGGSIRKPYWMKYLEPEFTDRWYKGPGKVMDVPIKIEGRDVEEESSRSSDVITETSQEKSITDSGTQTDDVVVEPSEDVEKVDSTTLLADSTNTVILEKNFNKKESEGSLPSEGPTRPHEPVKSQLKIVSSRQTPSWTFQSKKYAELVPSPGIPLTPDYGIPLRPISEVNIDDEYEKRYPATYRPFVRADTHRESMRVSKRRSMRKLRPFDPKVDLSIEFREKRAEGLR